jgi:hypothetical protein
MMKNEIKKIINQNIKIIKIKFDIRKILQHTLVFLTK